MLKLEEIAEGRALLARAKAGEPAAVQDLGAWFGAYAGMMLDAFERVHAPLQHPKRRFCPECGNRSFWPHASWCSENERGPSEGEPPSVEPRSVGHLSDSELVQRSLTTGIAELGDEAFDAFEAERRGQRRGLCWSDLDPEERNAWRAAAERVWEMAR